MKLSSQKVVDSLKNCWNQIQIEGNQNCSQLMLIHMEIEGKHEVKNQSFFDQQMHTLLT
jgi:acid stress-induced BolA-like protein IbaG/YrbA